MREDIKLLGLDLPMGTSRLVCCPVCKATHEKSFSVTRNEEGLLYNCFRAKCNARGFIPSKGTGTYSRIGCHTNTSNYNIYNYNITYPLRDMYNIIYLNNIYNITIPDIKEQRIGYNTERDTLVYPVYNYYGKEIGVVDRSYSGRTPKAISYWYDTEAPKIHYPRGRDYTNGTMCLVEDIPSAIVLGKHIPCCALLGHGISEPVIDELLGRGVKHLVLCLDGDVITKAIRYKRKYLSLFETVRVIFVKKDPKNMNDGEIEEMLVC